MQNAYALSCMAPVGDQVVSLIGHNTNPLWFGEGVLLSVEGDMRPSNHDPIVAKFKITDTFLTVHEMAELSGDVDVTVSGFHRTWGEWANIDAETSRVKLGEPHAFVVMRNEDGSLGLIAPGGCTYFSDDEWKQLRSGFYAEYSGEQGAKDDCAEATTQADMNECSNAAYKASQADLERVYNKALDRLADAKKDEFVAVQTLWAGYRARQCEYAAQQYEGGSIVPLIHATCMRKVTDDRIDDIRNMFNEWDQ